MANEFERINNPDSTPGAVSTGYQLQNTNLIAQRVGLDCSVVLGGTGQCTLEISGPVDVNGEIYTCNSQVIFPLVTAGKYYIHLAGSGANLTPTIGTGANTFDADKNARYTDTGTYRVLNWVIGYDGVTARVSRLVNPVLAYNDLDDSSHRETWITANNTWTAPQTKYYTFYITGSGGDGVIGGGGVNIAGGAGGTGIKRILVNAGTTWTATFSAVSGNNTTFSDGTTTLTAPNGLDTSSGGTSFSTGFDVQISGGDGSQGVGLITVGGSSYYGGGSFNRAANCFGSGGSCNGSTVFSGKSGVIRIIG